MRFMQVLNPSADIHCAGKPTRKAGKAEPQSLPFAARPSRLAEQHTIDHQQQNNIATQRFPCYPQQKNRK